MKKIVFVLTFVSLIINQTFSQGRWEWARKAGDIGYDLSGPIVSDGSGIYVAGSFDDPSTPGNVAFGSLTVTGVATNSEYSNAFVAAYNSDGSTCSWVKPFTGVTNTTLYMGKVWITAISQTTNDLFVAVYFQGVVDFGGSLGSQSSEYGKGLIIKMSKSNGAITASTIADTDPDMEIFGIASAGSTVVVTGRVRPNYWGSYTDFFVASYASSDLSFDWSAISPSSSGGASGQSIILNGNYVFVYGSVDGSIVFKNENGNNSSYSITSASYDAFIIRYSISGNVGDLNQIGFTANAEGPAGICVDESNYIYIAGNYEGTASTLTYLDPTLNSARSVAAAGYSDIYWAKYQQDLDYVTSGRIASSGFETAYGIAVNFENFIGAGFFIAGYTQSSGAAFCTSTNYLSSNAGLLKAKYVKAGTPAWVEQTPNAVAYGISEDPSTHRMNVAGGIYNTATFNSTVLTPYGSTDIFIGQCTKPACAGADICITSPTQIGCDPVSGGTYSWSPGTGLNYTNIAQPTASAAGTYTLTMTVNGCVNVDAIVVTSSPCRVGQDLMQHDASIYISPNPARNNFTVSLNNDENIQSVQLIDLSGRVLMRELKGDSESTAIFNVSERQISNGIYIVEVTTDLGKYKSKVIIQ